MSRPELAFAPAYQRYFDEPAGREHYRLLEKLSAESAPGSVLVDVGTLHGSSALALAANPAVEVWSYDISSHIPAADRGGAAMRATPNISWRLQNGIAAIPEFAGRTSLILLDVDPHDGVQELEFFAGLARAGYRGRVVCDDIHLNEAMRAWWAGVTQRKEDWTAQGHWSGTGIVYFD